MADHGHARSAHGRLHHDSRGGAQLGPMEREERPTGCRRWAYRSTSTRRRPAIRPRSSVGHTMRAPSSYSCTRVSTISPSTRSTGCRRFDSVDAVEIYNHNTFGSHPDRADGAYMVDGLLERGRRILVNAGDDAHFAFPGDRFGGWVEVWAEVARAVRAAGRPPVGLLLLHSGSADRAPGARRPAAVRLDEPRACHRSRWRGRPLARRVERARRERWPRPRRQRSISPPSMGPIAA